MNPPRRIVHSVVASVAVFSVFFINSGDARAALDPLGCRTSPAMTTTEFRDAGYEPVGGLTNANGVVSDGTTDVTASLQAVITQAHLDRRVVYFHPGTYLVSDTLDVVQEPYTTNSNDSRTRYGNVLMGSYCGDERPTILLGDGIDIDEGDGVTPVIHMYRTDGSGGTQDSRDWNQVIRNLHIDLNLPSYTQKNSGAVGFWHGGSTGQPGGAEGSSVQEVSVDATDGFAGFYQLSSSGGYTYNIEVTGGKYGVYLPGKIRGGSTLIAGVKLSGQTVRPIVWPHYTPLTLVGFDITSASGKIISSSVGGAKLKASTFGIATASGHVSMIDGKITVSSSSQPAIENEDASVYMKNVYARGGNGTIVQNNNGGDLTTSNTSDWSRIGEYAYANGYGGSDCSGGANPGSGGYYNECSKVLDGVKTENTYLNGDTSISPATAVATTEFSAPPTSLISQHLYPVALCNVEANGMLFATDFGADPDTIGADDAGINAMLTSAASGAKRAFLPAGAVQGDGRANAYEIAGTITIPADVTLCGATRYSSTLDAAGWTPGTNSPIIQTLDTPNAKTVMADFGTISDAPTGSYPSYSAYVYGIHWRAGANSVSRDIYHRAQYGDPGDRKNVQITDGGGGRWYGPVMHGGYRPSANNGAGAGESFRLCAGGESPPNCTGNYVLHPDARLMKITGTTQPLSFYSFHCQHLTQPEAAMCEIDNASHVTMYAIKQEMASLPQIISDIISDNPVDTTPIWLRVTDSDHISLFGYESHAEVASGRGVIEFIDSIDVTVANMGHRDYSQWLDTPDQWDFVQEITGATVTAKQSFEGMLSLYKKGIDTTAPIVNITAPTKTDTSSITDTTIHVTDNNSILAAHVGITEDSTVATSDFNCTQTNATTVDCTLSIDESGDLIITVVDHTGNASTDTEATYVIGVVGPTVTPTIHYPLNDGTGTTANDTQGSNNGTLFNTPTWNNTTQKLGSHALDFDGGNTANDYVEVAHSADLSQSEFSASTWFRLDQLPSTAGSNATIARKRRSVAPFYIWDLSVISATDKLLFRVHDGTSTYTAESDSAIVAGTWYHTVARLDASGNATLHIDAAQQAIADTGASVTTANPDALRIGAGGATANGLDGTIDDMCYFPYTLSQIEIDALYNFGTGTECYGGIRANVNASANIDILDAALIQRESLGLDMSVTPWVSTPTTGDTDCNGSVNAIDALLVQRFALSLSMAGTPWCAVN